MAVVTLAQYKTLMGIITVDATRDARIVALIPQIEQDIIDYCNNTFRISAISLIRNITPTVVAGPIYSFVGTTLTEQPLAIGDTIDITGTVRNDGRYTIVTISATEIVVVEPVVAEIEVEAEIVLVQFPAPLQLYATRMIAYQMDHMADAGLISETIKTYKYIKSDKANDSYPKEILKGLDKYANIKTSRASRLTHYNDERGTWLAQEELP